MNQRKTALVLSGGGSRGAYQCGVWQALTELGIDIDIVVGVSVGALNGVMVVQGDVTKTANLWREMETDMVFDVDSDAQISDFAKEFLIRNGAGASGLKSLLEEYVDEEAVRKSPIDFGLLTVELPWVKPHYLWKEDIPLGKLYDYILASASAFPAVKPAKIDGNTFIDGGYEDNLPAKMALEKGADQVICVYLDAIGRFRPSQLEDIPNLTFIESKWDLGDFLVFDKLNAKRILRLGYLDAMKTFGIFDGEYYTFTRGAFDKRTLKQADYAARIFKLDPLILYRRETFREKLSESVASARRETDVKFDFANLGSFTNLSKIRELKNLLGPRADTLYAAQHLKEKGSSSFFASKSAARLFPEEISAAKLLVKWGLV